LVDVTTFVEVLFDYKSHVGKRQVNKVSHKKVIVIDVIESVTISEFELRLIKFTYFEMVTF
jgi:hypothetical protein